MVWQSLRKHKPLLIDIGLIVLTVIIANILFLSRVLNNNPLMVRSGIYVGGDKVLLAGQDTLDPNDGFTTQALGVGAMKQVFAGHMPWWNHYEQVGAPLAGEMQSAALFPFSVLLLLPGGYLAFKMALELAAGIGTYLVLRRLGCSRKVSVTGGIAFSLNGVFAWLGNAAENPVAFLPWLILGIEQAFSAAEHKRRFGYSLVAASLALSLYAGFPETAYIDGLFAVLWAGVRLFQLKGKKTRLAYTLKLGTGAVIGLLLAVPILIAFGTYLPHANVGLHSNAASTGLTTIGLPALLFPYIYGPIGTLQYFDAAGKLLGFWGSVGGYTSLLTVFLAVTGFLNRKHRLLVTCIAAWSVLVVAKIFALPILGRVLGILPGMGNMAFYRYAPAALIFGLLVCAAVGLDHLLRQQSVKLRSLLPALGVSAAVFVAVLPVLHSELHQLAHAPHRNLYVSVSLAWGLCSIAFVTIWLTKIRVKTSAVICGLVVIEALLFFVVPQLSAPRHPRIDEGPVRYLQAHLGNGQRFYTLGPIQPNYGTYYQIASINDNNLPIAKNWSSYVKHSLNGNTDPIVFTGLNMSDPHGSSPLDEFLKNIRSYEYTGVRYLVGPNQPAVTTRLQAAGLKQVYGDTYTTIFELPASPAYFSSLTDHCSASYDALDKATVSCAGPGRILRRELYMPGWSATDQDGKNLAIKQSGPLFQAVNVDKDTKKVSFTFTPPHMGVGYVLFVLGIAGLIAPGAYDLRRRLK